MGSILTREGDAGTVAGPFMAQVEQAGWPKRPVAAFIRPEDRDLFFLAVNFVTALRDHDAKWAKEVLGKFRDRAGVPLEEEPKKEAAKRTFRSVSDEEDEE